jgi:RNA polymerase primary sigma factor
MSDFDALNHILNAAGRVPLLTAEEEILLGRKVQAMMQLLEANPAGPYSPAERRTIRAGRKARDRMVTANLRLVANVCRKFLRTMPKLGTTPEDMMQDGILGLTRGVEKFDPERGYKLSTYIYWWIRQGINRGLHYTARTIRLPTHIAEKIFKSTHVTNQLRTELNREPTIAEIAHALDMPEAEYQRFLAIGNRIGSLDAALEEEGAPILNLVDDGSTNDSHLEDLSDQLDSERLRRVINEVLTDKQRMVVMLYYGIGTDETVTMREISRRMGCHTEAIRQNLQRALNKIKREMLLAKQVEDPLHQPWTISSAA